MDNLKARYLNRCNDLIRANLLGKVPTDQVTFYRKRGYHDRSETQMYNTEKTVVFTKEQLQAAYDEDENLNNIPLELWDSKAQDYFVFKNRQIAGYEYKYYYSSSVRPESISDVTSMWKHYVIHYILGVPQEVA